MAELNDTPYEYNYTFDITQLITVNPLCEQWSLGSYSVVLIFVYSAVFVFSVLGNGLVITVVLCMTGKRSSTDVYLMNLAVANLLFSMTLPFWCVYIHSEWVFGTFLCKLLSGLQEATFYSGVLLLSCISLDRYLAIVKATELSPRHRFFVGGLCCGVWLVAGLLSLPALLHREAFKPANEENMVCHENLSAGSMADWRVGIRVLHHTLGFFVPLTIMLFCYGFTLTTLLQARTGHKHRAMRVILVVVLAFVACWLPHNITVLADTLMRGGLLTDTCATRNRIDLALQVTEALAFLHCALNPILYAFIGQKFRNQLLRMLYTHGIIRKEVYSTYRRGTITSSSSRKTSVTL